MFSFTGQINRLDSVISFPFSKNVECGHCAAHRQRTHTHSPLILFNNSNTDECFDTRKLCAYML